MRLVRKAFICRQCRLLPTKPRFVHSWARLPEVILASSQEPIPPQTPGPRATIDLKHIRQNPTLYEQNCLERNYKLQSTYPARINNLHQQWLEQQREGRYMRERTNKLRKLIATPASIQGDEDPETKELKEMSKDELLQEARELKQKLSSIEENESLLKAEIEGLAIAMPNLTSDETPRGDDALVLSYINDHPEPEPADSDRVWRSHMHIGSELGILDFASAATSSGWGWYYLLDEGAQLEQALIQFALSVATRYGWRQVTPPSIVYGHIATACGFQPRDQHGETQSYTLAQTAADRKRGRPELVLAGTAEIPLAGMKADAKVHESELPLKRVGVSRCYRAEAGARGTDTKGLYRVHEFNKVEMFAWTMPGSEAAEDAFHEMLDIQTEILEALGLHCRVLEMPSTDLGASATRKNDIEAFFPSRRQKNGGWGEVTSASICTDYQTRRLSTRVKIAGVESFPWTVNGTALAVPRVLAAILENGWDEDRMCVKLPECLWGFMGMETIEMKRRLR